MRSLSLKRNRFAMSFVPPKLPHLRMLFPTFWLNSLILGIISTISIADSICAAEKIHLIYGPMNLSLKVESLATFATEGTINKELKFYLDRFTPEQQNQLRQLLLKKTKIDPVLLSRILNSQSGERLLTQLGEIITIQGGRNGSYILRGAIVQTALNNKELNLIAILQNLPTDIQIRIDQIHELFKIINRSLEQTKLVNQEMAKLSTLAAEEGNSLNFHQLPDLTLPGKFKFTEENIILKDEKRQREFYVHLYKPEINQEKKIPVVIISHGLAARPENFSKYARHLASYGYLVALPQHPGSDFKQIKNLITGVSREVFAAQEFVDRPLDITYLLDELERRNSRDFDGKLELNNVGVFGQSFGGYTAIALAGSEIDFSNLERDCRGKITYVNLSLMVQCRALELPRINYYLKDDRVKAVIASNPFNASIFGEQGLKKIQIPVLFVAGSYDPATPVIFEQIKSFYSLNSSEKYIGVIEGQAHLDLGELDDNLRQRVNKIAGVELAQPEAIDTYSNAIILAFFEVYISQNKIFLNYLNPSYSAYLSQNQPFKFYLLNKPLVNQLTPIVDRFKWDN